MAGHRLLRIILTDPNGTQYDLVDDFGVSLQSVGRLTEELADDLTTLMHSDMDLDIFDDAGTLSQALRAAQRGQIWRVTMERQDASGGAWQREFEGVLDVPMSIKISPRDREVSVTVFGLSKLLELHDAETVKRSFEAQTGSITASSKSLTLSPGSSLLLRGDRIKLDNGTTTEEFEIDLVSSPTAFSTVAAASNTFTSATATILTPYYRSKTVAQMVDLILAGTELSDKNVDVAQELSSVPFPSDLNTTGLPSSAPNGLLERGAKVSVYASTNRYDANTPSEAFTNAGADAVKVDWRPYKATEPGTLRAASIADDGRRAVDYDTGDYYELQLDVSENLDLYKNGAFLVQVAPGGTGGGASNTWQYTLDWHEGLSQIWVSYAHVKESGNGGFTANTQTSRFNSAGVVQAPALSSGGKIRYSQSLDRMLIAPLQASDITGEITDQGDDIELWNGTTFDRFLDGKTSLYLWTMRAMGSHVLCVRDDGARVSVVVWDATTGEIVADHPISVSPSSRRLATVWDAGGTATPYYIGYAGGKYFVVSTALSGVVPYANFDGMSKAAALRELALFSGGVFFVDRFGVVNILGRRSASVASQQPIEIDEQLDDVVEMPVSEWLKKSVHVTGVDEDGMDVEALVGARGESASRLAIELQIPISEGYASAIGLSFLNLLSTLGRQYDSSHILPRPDRIFATSRVSLDGVTYQVFRVETDYDREVQAVQYVEVGA